MTWTLAVASLVTIAVAHEGASYLAQYLDPLGRHSGFWMREGPAIGVAIALGLCWWPRWRLSRGLRVAVLLPVVQVVSVGVAMILWRTYAHRLPDSAEATPVLPMLPFSASRAIADGRRGEWLHAAATLALVQLLLVGLWLPIVANVWCADDTPTWYSWDDVANAIASPRLIAWVLVPPTIASTIFATVAIRRYDTVRGWRGPFAIVVAIALITATVVRLHLTLHNSLLYANFIHLVLALAVVAGGTLLALALSLWVRGRRDRRALLGDPITGVIGRDGNDPIACLQIAGWLRGPRMTARPFTVITRDGALSVPGGATIVCDPPDVSTRLASGEAVHLLRPGDRVIVTGFVAPPGGDPFRSSTARMPGTNGIFVGREIDAPAGFAGVTLSMWRPGIAFLLVVVAIALPALAGALATGL